MQIGALGDRVTDIDANAEADCTVGRLVLVGLRHPSLDLHSATDRSLDAVEYDQQRIAARLNYPASILRDRRADDVASDSPQPRERSHIVQTNETAVADHVGIDHGD